MSASRRRRSLRRSGWATRARRRRSPAPGTIRPFALRVNSPAARSTIAVIASSGAKLSVDAVQRQEQACEHPRGPLVAVHEGMVSRDPERISSREERQIRVAVGPAVDAAARAPRPACLVANVRFRRHAPAIAGHGPRGRCRRRARSARRASEFTSRGRAECRRSSRMICSGSAIFASKSGLAAVSRTPSGASVA